jgi:MbtH protein
MMKIVLLILTIVLGLLVTRTAVRALQPGGSTPAPPESLSEGEKAIARAKADIEKHGWHLLMVSGDGTSSFLYTIGLWKTYKHPEILLFVPSQDPRGLEAPFRAMVQRVVAGEKLKSGETYPKVFKERSGAIREVHHRWYPSFLGTAGAVYGNFDFPAVQLYWPDREGRFPWQGGFDPELFPAQPVLDQENLILANVGSAEVREIVQEEGAQVLEKSLDDLFVPLGQDLEEEISEWRWRVGPDAKLERVTVFGDLFLKTPDGHIHFLDTGSGAYVDIAADRETWIQVLCDAPAALFHASTLIHFRSLGHLPKAGEVYSWIKPPMLGGEASADNFDTISLAVHISNLARVAEALVEGKESEASDFAEDDGVIYAVVTNDEKQYSIWPADQKIPEGWKSTGKTGPKPECLEYIKTVWTDLRPESLRQKREAEKKDGPP